MEPLINGHMVWDSISGLVLIVLGVSKGVVFARSLGILPEVNGNGGPRSAKNVGRLSVDSLQAILRHIVGDMFNPLTVKMGEYHSRELDKLDEINLSLREVVTVLRERK